MRNSLKVMLVAVASSSFAVVPAMAEPAPAAATANAGKYSVDTTSIGTLIDDEKAKAVLQTHIPALVGNPQFSMARSMTLKQIQQFAGDTLSDQVMAKIQADLDKIPAS